LIKESEWITTSMPKIRFSGGRGSKSYNYDGINWKKMFSKPYRTGSKNMIDFRNNNTFLLLYSDSVKIQKNHKHKRIRYSDLNCANIVVDLNKGKVIKNRFGLQGQSLTKKDVDKLIFDIGDVKSYEKYCRMMQYTTDPQFIKNMEDNNLLKQIN
jgi:hypothetical protein